MFRRLFLFITVILVAGWVFSDKDVATVSPDANTEKLELSTESSPPASAVVGWQYLEPMDDITGKASRLARVKSSNVLSLPAPYSGANYGRLTVRQHPQYGLDVFVSVDKGQILCNGERYGKCALKIRFDSGEVEKFTALKAADGSATVVFSAFPNWALNRLKSANKVIVQMTMFKAGDQVLIFDIDEPLEW